MPYHEDFIVYWNFSLIVDNLVRVDTLIQVDRRRFPYHMIEEADLSKLVVDEIVYKKLECHLFVSESKWLENNLLEAMLFEEGIYTFVYR